MRGRSLDVFCRVVDNFGDAGVCWRLARKLAHEHGARVRLIIDTPAALAAMLPALNAHLAAQRVEDIDIELWPDESAAGQRPATVPADIVIEAFGCGLPEEYVTAMAVRARPPVWIVLEYLSAEAWVGEYHARPSPHPRSGIARYFFFPGFTPDTGGLLREPDLAARRDAFALAERVELWQRLGFAAPAGGARVLSLFAYGTAPLGGLITLLEAERAPAVVAVPAEPGGAKLLEALGITPAHAPSSARRGLTEIRVLPFLPQARFDELLWACDINFVRGEDSFVRAQWAGRPVVWHIYPQAEGAHRLKLDAFLDRYGEGLAEEAGRALRGLWHAWNGITPHPPLAEAWRAFAGQEVVLVRHARNWAARLEKLPDLGAELARFCTERLK